MGEKTEVDNSKTELTKMNLYQKILLCSKDLNGIEKSQMSGRGSYWDAGKIFYHVWEVMNKNRIIHNVDILKSEAENQSYKNNQGEDCSRWRVNVELIFTYINIDNPSEREVEKINFNEINFGQTYNLPGVISKAKKTHYISKFNVVESDSEQPLRASSGSGNYQQPQRQSQQKNGHGSGGNFQNFGPDWIFTFGEFKGTALKDVPTHALLEYLNSEKVYDKLKLAIRFFLKSKGFGTEENT